MLPVLPITSRLAREFKENAPALVPGGRTTPTLLATGFQLLSGLNFVILAGGGCGTRPQVLLIEHAVVAHHEAHHARVAVGDRPRDHGVAADHRAFCHVVVSATLGVGPLCFQDAGICSRDRRRRSHPCRSRPSARPRSAARAGSAARPPWSGNTGRRACRRTDEFLRVLLELRVLRVERVVLALRVHVGKRRLHREQLVPPDAAVEKFLRARLAVEMPARSILHHGYRERPAVLADAEHRLRVALISPGCSPLRTLAGSARGRCCPRPCLPRKGSPRNPARGWRASPPSCRP